MHALNIDFPLHNRVQINVFLTVLNKVVLLVVDVNYLIEIFKTFYYSYCVVAQFSFVGG